MNCYGNERDYLNGTYPNIPDFSSLKVNNTETPSNVCKYCYRSFMECGCSTAAALGICANLAEESGFQPDIITWDGSRKTGKFGIGGGLCGFYRFGDLPNLAAYAKNPPLSAIVNLDNAIRNCGRLPKPKTPVSLENSKFIRKNFCNFPYTLQQQVGYLVSLINGKYSEVKTKRTPSEAALWWCKKYGRPAIVTDRWKRQGNLVVKYLNS